MFKAPSKLSDPKFLRWMMAVVLLGISMYIGTSIGVPSAQSSTSCTIINPGEVVYASECTGVDAGAQIVKAIAALHGHSGTVNAHGLTPVTGVFTISNSDSIVLGTTWTQSVSLLLGAGKWVVGKTIIVNMGSSIVGVPTGAVVATRTLTSNHVATNLVAASYKTLKAVVQLGRTTTASAGFNSVLQYVAVNGNAKYDGTKSTGSDILVTTGRVRIAQVSATNSAGNGIDLSTHSEASKLTEIFAAQNAGSGISIAGAVTTVNDIFISDSEIEGNGQYGSHTDCGGGKGTGPGSGAGIYLNNAAALRLTHSDISGNDTGIVGLGTSGEEIITGNQFATQCGHDIQLSATTAYGGINNNISSNDFIGAAHGETGYDAVQLWGTNNVVDSNDISMSNQVPGSHRYAGIQFVTHPTAHETVTGNMVTGGNSSIDVMAGSAIVAGLSSNTLD